MNRSESLPALWPYPLILVVALGGVWSLGIQGDFLWVDRVEILESGYRVTDREEVAEVWTRSLDSFLEREHGELESQGGYLRPIYSYSISLDWWLWQDNPLGYKIVNIVWHGLVVLGLFILGIQLLSPFAARIAISFWAALLFALHPFGIHSVTWISGRKDTLCASLAIGALIVLGRLIHCHKLTCWKTIGWLTLMGFSLNLAMFSKELAVVTPVIATVWFWFELGRPKGEASEGLEKASYRPAGLGLVIMWLSTLFCFLYRHVVIGGIGLSAEYASSSMINNLTTSCRLITCYVGRILYPVDPTIVDRWRISQALGVEECMAMSFVAFSVLTTCWLIWRRKREGMALAWFGIWLLPAMGLLPLNHMYAERYLYPASWGLCLFLVFAIFRGAEFFQSSNRQGKDVVIRGALLITVAICFACISIRSFSHWDSEETLFRHSIEQDNFYVEGQSAMALHELGQLNYRESLRHSELALESAGNREYQSYWSPQVVHTNAGLAAYHLGEFDKAYDSFSKARDARPKNSMSYYHLAKVYFAKGDKEVAVRHFEQAIELWPENHLARNDLGFLYLNSREFAKCVEVMEPIFDSDSVDERAHSNIGSAHLMLSQYAQAAESFTWLCRQSPNDPGNFAKLAWCMFELGESQKAKTLLSKAFSLHPDNEVARFVQQKYLAEER